MVSKAVIIKLFTCQFHELIKQKLFNADAPFQIDVQFKDMPVS